LAIGALFAASGAAAGKPDFSSGERLSDWLLRQPLADRYPPGLLWQVPAEQASQARTQQELLATLAVAPNLNVLPDRRKRMADWIGSLPVTGRVPIALPNPRWLQAHPSSDPRLDADHVLSLPARPHTVTVIRGTGERCTLPHRSGAEIPAYLAACQADLASRVDIAWIVQPDGQVQRYGVASWNRQAQGEPAPGAAIWAPERDSGWPEWFSAKLVQFFATQGVGFSERGNALPLRKTASPVTPTANRARNAAVSSSDWGGVGLLQTPSARMADTGDMRFSASHVYPYARVNILFQPFDWMEAGFRYTAIRNKLYGPTALSGTQNYKDKSIDVKFRLNSETAYMPQLAVGFVDIGGTGLFASEYVVANKRFGDFDWSLGVAWGYLGNRGNLKNPLSIFGNGFNKRHINIGQSGNFSVSSWFSGPAALFGGVQYHTPWESLILKAELDGNDYRKEPLGGQAEARSPLNVGFVYRLSDSLDLSGGLERGNRVMFNLTYHGGLDKITMPKLLDPPLAPVAAIYPTQAPNWSRTVADIEAQTLWHVSAINLRGSELHVVLEESRGEYWRDRIERAVRLLHRDSPASISRFVFSHLEHGMPMTEQVVLRDEWLAQHTEFLPPAQRQPSLADRRPGASLVAETPLWKSAPDRFMIGLTPAFQQNVGGPDSFFLYQAGVGLNSSLKFSNSTWIDGRMNLRLIDNYDSFKYDPPSGLPRVRTDLREYFTRSRTNLSNLQLTHVGRLSENQYYSVYGGYLEWMFAGVGAEWLYRPWQSRFALGVDLNRVRKRGFKQDFELLDYRTTTGHATLYWDTGWNSVNASLSVGRYLAGDYGATLDVSRKFANGVVLGAMASKTNASRTAFGEGSFDKGIYMSIPFDAILPMSSREYANFNWHPLTRDGGAKLGRAISLFDLTKGRDKRLLSYVDPAQPFWKSDDDAMPERERSLFKDFGKTVQRVPSQVASVSAETWLMGGGLVLASSLLDRPAERWAKKHQGGKWDRMGRAGSGIPIALGAGAGLLWLGLGDETASATAWSAIKGAGITVAAETLTKVAVGRARPEDELGPGQIKGFSSGSGSSSFPSIHMGVAFSLVTPFAERYGADWLYAVAGATAFGRIQERQHFFSDTVAGGLIGYGIGTLMLEQQRNGPKISIGADRTLRAYWEFD